SILLAAGHLNMFQEYQNNAVIVTHYNFTGKLKENKYKDGLKPEAIVFLIICLLIVLENSVVLAAIWKNKKFHLPMYYLLGNLTFSDLLAGFTYMVNIWFIREGGVFITLAASIISLLAIAIERHVTMVQMKPYQGSKRGRMFALIVASWVLSVFLGVLPIMGWNCIDILDQCSTVLPLYSKSFILCCITVFSAILLAIVVLYVRIFCIVKSTTPRLVWGPQRKSSIRKAQKYMALLKTVTIVVGVFIICWLPLFVLLLLDFCCPAQSCQVLLKADYFLGVAMLNSLFNPIIYTLTSKDMRRAILRLIFSYCLLTKDGELEGLETTVTSGNFTPSTIKAIYPRMSKT
uniref:G-protein coupled receptors family 1 profile domain-containing protein n=1 Tax=Electrophorus electricus TaxID=8005 RepID=A0A4W4EVD0_ELEEL